MNTLTLKRPDDWHLHLRDGEAMRDVLDHTAQRFARAVVMPNLRPPVTTVAMAAAYRERILAALSPGRQFEPLMSLYLTDRTDPVEVERAAEAGFVCGFKYYPAGATTHSDAGVTDLKHTWPVLERMEALGVVLQLHGEATGGDIDPFDREAVFIDRELSVIVKRFPRLKIVLEHVTTRHGVEFVAAAGDNVTATLTPQHLLLNRGAMFEGGLRVHLYCLPVLKRERDRESLLAAATSGNPKFFLGTDSAPHEQGAKESACGCAGVYSAHAGIELYAEAFDEANALDRLEGFASRHGAAFYGYAPHEDSITLQREPWVVPSSYTFGPGKVIPFRAGGQVAWSLKSFGGGA